MKRDSRKTQESMFFTGLPVLFLLLAVLWSGIGAQESWEKIGKMNYARFGHACASLDGKLYVSGGFGAGYYVASSPGDSMECYDPETKKWTILPNMPSARDGHAMVSVNGKLYIIGGFDHRKCNLVHDVDVYDPKTSAWETETTLDVGFEITNAVVWDGIIYLPSGYHDKENTFYAYNPATRKLTRKKNMPNRHRYYTAMCASEGKIYIIGGYSSCEKMSVYDIASDSWESHTLPFSIASHSAAVLNGKIYIMGGRWVMSPAQTSMFEYDPMQNVWTQKPEMHIGRTRADVAVLNNKLFITGGYSDRAEAEGEVYCPIIADNSSTGLSMISK